MSAEYRDFWREFRLIQEASKKKLLKQPNYAETINQLQSLSTEMEDAEMPEHAAVCHREIAIFYEQMQNWPAERRHLIKAAHLFFAARLIRRQMHISIMQESETLMEECYLKAIDKSVKQGFVKLAGATCVETAEHFLQFGDAERAYFYYVQGSRYIQTDVYINSHILQKICCIADAQPCMDQVLTDIQTIWSCLLKNMPFTNSVRELLLNIECHIVLLNLRHSLLTKDIQRSILLQYSEISQWQNLKLSMMTKEEFLIVSKFVQSVRSSNYFESSKILAFHLNNYLNADAKKLAAKIVDLIDHEPVVDRGFEDIKNSTTYSELEKRSKIFELYNSLIRKNQLKLEHL